jgi:hypothetical protein
MNIPLPLDIWSVFLYIFYIMNDNETTDVAEKLSVRELKKIKESKIEKETEEQFPSTFANPELDERIRALIEKLKERRLPASKSPTLEEAIRSALSKQNS